MSFSLYRNTPDNAIYVGWAHFPEHCIGNPKSEFVLHDNSKGTFYYLDIALDVVDETARREALAAECRVLRRV